MSTDRSRGGKLLRCQAAYDAASDVAFGSGQAEDLPQHVADAVAPFDIRQRQECNGRRGVGKGGPVERCDGCHPVAGKKDAGDGEQPSYGSTFHICQRLLDIGRTGGIES